MTRKPLSVAIGEHYAAKAASETAAAQKPSAESERPHLRAAIAARHTPAPTTDDESS